MPIDRTSHLVAQEPKPNGQHRSFYRAFSQFLCSNMGLIIIVFAYSIGGAFLFILLEQYIELQNCQQANLLENVSISNISESMYNYVIIADDEDITVIYDEIVSYLENFTNDIYDRRDEFRYTGQDCLTVTGWTFPSALLFTITIMTSIGFGHVTPTSWEGQITCICYALIGIPIFLLCLANLSSILGDMFRFAYSSFLHCICCCCRVYARTNRRRFNPRKVSKRHGIQYVGKTSTDPSWPDDLKENADGEYDDDDGGDEIDDDFNDVFDRMERRVPILVVVSIIISYVCLGAIMFKNTEGWTMTESVYFCYVTLSTMGFGDFVPGITSSGTNSLRFFGACLYIIIGLAILAMCFDLIKESIVDKFAWLASKLGVASDDDEDDDDTDNPVRYSNFQYSTPRDLLDHRQMHTALDGRLSESPPAYDDANDGDQWLKDIRDKPSSPTVKKR